MITDKMPQSFDIKEKFREILAQAIVIVRDSSWRQRLIVAAPVLAALIFAGLTVLLDIFLREEGSEGWILNLLGTTGLFLFFFAPFAYVSVKLYRLIRPRLRERRFMDALRLGLYLPHAFAILIIVISQLEGSENITSLGAALITWAMLSLLLSPFSVLLALLGWSYLPKEVPEPLLQITSRLNSRGQNLLSAPTPEEDRDPLTT